jgi:hypothetical protein
MRHLPNTAHSKIHQRVLEALANGDWLTTFEICLKGEVTNPSGIISELRANGYHIETKYVGESSRGARVWQYRWMRLEAALN